MPDPDLMTATRKFEVVTEAFFEKYEQPMAATIGAKIAEVTEPTKDLLLSTAEQMYGIAKRKDLNLSYGMQALHVRFKSIAEQQRDFTSGGVEDCLADAEVSTYTAAGAMASYMYDRNTGLIIVNGFDFNPTEVRKPSEDELDDLSFSMRRGALVNIVCGRILTLAGVERITQDIASAY